MRHVIATIESRPQIARALRVGLLALLCWIACYLGLYAAALAPTGWLETVDAGERLAASLALTPFALVIAAASARLVSRGLAAVPGLPHMWESSRLAPLRCALARIDRLLFSRRVRSVLLVALILLLCWSFWIVAFYPGSMIYDTYYQITQFYPRTGDVHIPVWSVPNHLSFTQFSDHHPVVDTLIYGWFAYTSDQLFGTWNVGIFAFAVLQAAGTALAFAVAFGYLRRIGAPRGAVLAALAFVCAVPVYGAYAAVVVKDMLFAGIYVVWFTAVIAIVHTRGSVLRRTPVLAVFLLITVALCLTKKTGIYIAIPTLIVLAALYRRQWARLVAPALAAAVVMWGIMPGLVFPALNVAPGGSQEMLGTLFQQTARYVSEHGLEVSARERRAIDAVLDYDTLAERYEPGWADPVKYKADPEATSQELAAYLQVWLEQGLRHPETYFEATLAMLTGFVSPAEPIQLRDETWGRENDGSGLIYQPWQLDDLRDAARDAWEAFSEAPVAGLALTCAPYVLWVPLFALWACLCHLRRWLPVMVPVLLSVATVALSPMYDARYATALIDTAPLLVLVLAAGFAADGYRVRAVGER